MQSETITNAVDWQHEYKTNSKLWQERCDIILNNALDAVNNGYGIIASKPLTKHNLGKNDSRRGDDNHAIKSPIMNPKTVAKNWGIDGKYRGFNYAIVAGGHVAIVDLDVRPDKGINGIVTLERLEEEHKFKLPRDFVVHTPNGGMHIYLPRNPGLSLNGNLDDGIEVFQSDSDDFLTAHKAVRGPGSVIDEGTSEYVGKIPTRAELNNLVVPLGFSSLVAKRFITNRGNIYPLHGNRPDYVKSNGRGNEEVGEDDEDIRKLKPLTWPQVRNIFDQLHPDISLTEAENYDWWMTCGRALRHYTMHTRKGHKKELERGTELWLNFCKMSHDWDEKDAFDKWDNQFDRDPSQGSITTMATLIAAIKNRQEIDGTYTSTKAILDNTPAAVLSLVEQFAYHKGNDTIIDLTAPAAAAQTTAAAWRRANCVSMETANSFFMNPDKSVIDIDGYYPGKGRVYKDNYGRGEITYYNTFELAHHPRVRADTSVIWEHIEFLVPNQKERKEFVNYLAWCLQNLGDRPSFVPLMVTNGIQGVGRSLLVTLIEGMVGKWNTSRFKMENAVGNKSGNNKWDDWRYRKVFTACEEVKEPGSNPYIANNDFRDIITAEGAQQLNLKGGRNLTENVFNFMLLLSNHSTDAMIIPNDDRRLFVIQNPDEKRSAEYYMRVGNAVDPKNNPSKQIPDPVHAFYWEMMDMDLNGYSAKKEAMRTEAKSRMIECGKSETEVAFDAMLEDVRNNEELPAVGTYKDIVEFVKRRYFEGHLDGFSDKQCRKLIENNLITWQGDPASSSKSKNRLKMAGGNNVRVRVLRGAAHWTRTPSDPIRTELKKWSDVLGMDDH